VDRRLFIAGIGAVVTAHTAVAQSEGPSEINVPDGGLPAADFAVVARRTAFINVDMQNCFVEGYPSSVTEGPTLLRQLNGFAARCRGAGVRVIHTAHVLRPDGSNAGVMTEYIPAVRQGMINRGSHASALHKDLVIDPRDIVLEKPRFGAFHGTDLELVLRTTGIDTVIIGGIATNVCCETTAREATVRDFRVLFLSDGTATFPFSGLSANQLQQATCASLKVFGEVLTIERVLRKLRAI
jgi:nicotinamidase-related amidase